jgi:hypothetical protein
MPTTSFLKSYRAAANRAAHPHLAPINAVTLQSDRAIAIAKATSLTGYRNFLVAARAAKAQRNGVSMAFERNVQTQARQALDDVQGLAGAVLRITQQANHTDLWNQMHDRLTTALANGPVSAKQVWSEIQHGLQDAQYKPTLQSAGLTDDIAAAMSDVIAKLDANVVLRNGQIAIETKVAGEAQPRRLLLKAPSARPAGIADLLRRAQFDQVVSAISNNDPVYVEAVASTSEPAHEPAELFAIGAVSARQGMADHVRKLEDTGLATYQGNDPGTVILVAFIAALVVGALGAGILYMCDHPDGVEQPDFVCDIAFVLILLATMVLGAVAVLGGGGLLALGALLASQALYADVIAHMPTFHPPAS